MNRGKGVERRQDVIMSLVVPPFLQCRGAIVEDVLDSLPLRAQLAYSRWLLFPLMQICIVWEGVGY